MKKTFLCFLFFILYINLYAKENSGYDSLAVKQVYEYAKKQRNIDFEKSIRLNKTAVQMAEQAKYQKGILYGLHEIARLYFSQSKFDLAKEYGQKCLEYSLQKNDSSYLILAYSMLSKVGTATADFKDALNFQLKALQISEKQKDKSKIATSYSNIAYMYSNQDNFSEAIKYQSQALKLYTEVQDKKGIAQCYNNFGIYYSLMEKYTEALDFFLKSIKLREEWKNKEELSYSYNNIGGLYTSLNQYNLAIAYFKKALPLFEERNDEGGVGMVYHNLGNIYEKLKQWAVATKYQEESLTIFKKTGDKDGMMDSYEGLLNISRAKKDYANAVKYYGLFLSAKDSILNKDNSKQVAELQIKYETEKKEKENVVLLNTTQAQQLQIVKQKNLRNILIGSFLIILFLSGLLYNRYQLKQKALLEGEIAKQEKLRFKAMIESEEKERARIAQELHDGLGQMLSTARLNMAGMEDAISEENKPFLDRSLTIIDESCQEVRNISHNMMPSSLIRLGLIPAIGELVGIINSSTLLKINFSTNVAEPLGESLDITIYRIVQEVLNNMIKHAKADLITLEINQNNNNLIINITDNGIGFDTSLLAESTGLGWKGVFSRVSLFNGTIELDSKSQQGTTVCIHLPLEMA